MGAEKKIALCHAGLISSRASRNTSSFCWVEHVQRNHVDDVLLAGHEDGSVLDLPHSEADEIHDWKIRCLAVSRRDRVRFFSRRFKARGYDTDELREAQRKGGLEFFSSQIIVQENQSGSGTYDLRMFHGLYEPQYYRNVTAWDDKHFKVQLFEGAKVLCPDIATGCDQHIFYDRREN